MVLVQFKLTLINKVNMSKLNEQRELKRTLKKYIKKGDTVFTSLGKDVSSSGTYRHIKILVINKKRILNVSWQVSELLGWTYKDNTNSIGVGGGGMDMGFHLVYHLSSKLFKGDRSGYAINHQWI